MEENAYLVLGCYGRKEDGFVLCPAAENRILTIKESLNSFDEIMDYLDAIGLFDRPMMDINAIRHLVFNLQDRYDQKVRRLWTEREFSCIERFIHMHKPCGLYAQIIVVPSEIDVPDEPEEQSCIVKGTKVIEKAERKPELKLIRGRVGR